MSELKKCPKCKQFLPLDAFGKNKGTKDGLQVYCRKCCSIRDKQFKEKHPDRKREFRNKYYQEHKDHIKEYDKKYRETHKEHIKEYMQTYREEHKEEIREYKKQYQKEYYKTEQGKAAQHKHRAKKKNINDSFTSSEWLELCAEFNNKCAYCGIERNLTPDHVKPLNKGGENNINNIVPACIACNLEKNTNDLSDSGKLINLL